MLTAYTIYPIVRSTAIRQFKMRVDAEDLDPERNDFDIMWADHRVAPERMMKLKAYHRVSQIPGIECITHKNHLGEYLNRIKFVLPEEFEFFPDTYLLPREKARLDKEWKED
jgi:hypothetical protein